jgi:hypothetical protein
MRNIIRFFTPDLIPLYVILAFLFVLLFAGCTDMEEVGKVVVDMKYNPRTQEMVYNDEMVFKGYEEFYLVVCHRKYIANNECRAAWDYARELGLRDAYEKLARDRYANR